MFVCPHLSAGSLNSLHHDSTAKVSAQIDQVSTLFNDRSARFVLVPPDFRLDLSIRANVFGARHHNWLAGALDDVLHVLDDLEVSKHVADGGDCAGLLEVLS